MARERIWLVRPEQLFLELCRPQPEQTKLWCDWLYQRPLKPLRPRASRTLCIIVASRSWTSTYPSTSNSCARGPCRTGCSPLSSCQMRLEETHQGRNTTRPYTHYMSAASCCGVSS